MLAKAYFKILAIIFLVSACSTEAKSQLYFKGALKNERQKVYRNLIQNTINKNLAKELNDETEEDWSDAFYAMQVLQYKTMWADGRIAIAASEMPGRSVNFQRAVLEVLYSLYPGKFYNEVKLLLMDTKEPMIFSMAASYILNSDKAEDDINFLIVKTRLLQETFPNEPRLEQLTYDLRNFQKDPALPSIKDLFSKNFLPGYVVVYSFQRKNRDYPGLVMVRSSQGSFIKDSSGRIFSVPQLARSITNLPPYVRNGNTPQGIFRMHAYDVSRASFIGPTVNVQLTMPFEKSPSHFFNNTSLSDSTWYIRSYLNLLPASLRNYFPLQQSWYSGQAGRSEIIIHGTTVNPTYYKDKPYYPLTPTLGCLTSKETWSEQTGQRQESDQQKLINALIKAGGPNGYAVVINIDNKEMPVTLEEILQLMNK